MELCLKESRRNDLLIVEVRFCVLRFVSARGGIPMTRVLRQTLLDIFW
jgi:hypothetical protein